MLLYLSPAETGIVPAILSVMGSTLFNEKYYWFLLSLILVMGTLVMKHMHPQMVSSTNYLSESDDDEKSGFFTSLLPKKLFGSGPKRGRYYQAADDANPGVMQLPSQPIQFTTGVAESKKIATTDAAKKEKDKKKKAKNLKPIINAKSEAAKKEKNHTSTSSANSFPLGGGYITNTQASQNTNNQTATPTKQDKNINTLDYWVDPIFNKLQLAAVMDLISSFKGKQVSSQVFYNLVLDMNHDSRTELRQYGVYALTATPSSTSFSLLSWVKNNDTDSQVRSSATQQVTSYSDSTKLGYIVTTLGSSGFMGAASQSDVNKILIDGLQVVQVAAQQYSGVSSQGNSGTTKNNNSSMVYNALTQAVQVINSNEMKSTDATVKAEAQKTINTVNQYLKL